MARTVLVRHAVAGDKRRWLGDDALRPLEAAGHDQARELVARLAALPVRRVLTSPYLRCRQSVQPLCAARGLLVEDHDALRPDAPVGAVLALLRDAADDGALVCTHGEVLLALGLDWRAGDPVKGGAWLVEHPLRAGARPVPVGPRLPAQRPPALQPTAG